MKVRAKYIAVISFIILTVISGAESAKAREAVAKCAPQSLKSALEDSAAIFSGKVKKIEQSGDTKLITFEVGRYWKGKLRKTVTLHIKETMRYGIFYVVGERYLVFSGLNNEGKLSDRRCSRSKNLEYAGDDLKSLGAGKKPRSK